MVFTCLPACLCSLRDFYVKIRILFDLQLPPWGPKTFFSLWNHPGNFVPIDGTAAVSSREVIFSFVIFFLLKIYTGLYFILLFRLFYYFKVTANNFILRLGEWKVMCLCTAILFQTLVSSVQVFTEAKETAERLTKETVWECVPIFWFSDTCMLKVSYWVS